MIGSEEASDVWTVRGAGVAPRHASVWLVDGRMEVEDLAGGTLVNGQTITGRVGLECPASVQVGEITLVVELKAGEASAVETGTTPESDSRIAVTIPQRVLKPSASSLEVTIPQRPLEKRFSGTDVTIPQKPAAKTGASSPPRALQRSLGGKSDAPLSGGYTLVREIARGGMGQIYFGEDPQLERQVAVKVSSISEGGEDPRFSKEAKVLAQLAHPNIVPIHNLGVDSQNRPFYSMKLVKGRTLQAVLNAIRDGDAAALREYPRAGLLTIFRKVCDAMAFAHSKRILHRDLKP